MLQTVVSSKWNGNSKSEFLSYNRGYRAGWGRIFEWHYLQKPEIVYFSTFCAYYKVGFRLLSFIDIYFVKYFRILKKIEYCSLSKKILWKHIRQARKLNLRYREMIQYHSNVVKKKKLKITHYAYKGLSKLWEIAWWLQV